MIIRLKCKSIKGKDTRLITLLITLSSLLFTMTGCRIEPPLHLPDTGENIETYMPMVRLDLDVLWKYEIVVDSVTGEVYDTTYNWRDDFYYGWDTTDDNIFGTWEIVDPSVFNIRRYYTGTTYGGAHTAPSEHQINGRTLLAHYDYGYYDILAWNEVTTLDGVQSLHFDESTTFEYVTAYTNQSMAKANSAKGNIFSYYQPEFLFSGYYTDLLITNRKEDYDYYDEERKVYVKLINMTLYPRTYIYITQIILHNNKGRIMDVDGTANLSGMASSTNLNTGITNSDEISVNFCQRMKRHCDYKGEDVDIVGGRLFTFGLCNMNPGESTRASARENTSRNYIDVNLVFNNGIDSTFVFDVTDQVHNRYKGGILTIELDVDSIPIPSVSGTGSGFDAVVEDYDSLQYEFDMAKRQKRRKLNLNK